MKRRILIPLALGALLMAGGAVAFSRFAYPPQAEEVVLHGAGATFPAPLYQRWFVEYGRLHPNAHLTYDATGSGDGVKQFLAGQVDFGASDTAMTDEEMAKAPNGVQFIPLTAGLIVFAYNPKGLPGRLTLTRKALSGICLGTIVSWDDPEIADCNDGVQMPKKPIVFIHQADKSGTTFALTTHLSAVSDDWAKGKGLGVNADPAWPVGQAGKGNEGVVDLIKQTPGAVGYLAYSYARDADLPTAALENNAGSFVAPSVDGGQESLTPYRLPANLRGWNADPVGKTAYPIVTFTWLLCRRKYDNPKAAAAMRALIRYGLTDGQHFSEELGYLPLPDTVIASCMPALDNIGSLPGAGGSRGDRGK